MYVYMTLNYLPFCLNDLLANFNRKFPLEVRSMICYLNDVMLRWYIQRITTQQRT